MAHALTGGELAIIRENNQASELYMAVQSPGTVFSALANLPAPASGTWSNNSVYRVPYTSSTFGVETDVVPGMTMYVGSSGSAIGSYDVGMVRVRESIVTGSFISDLNISGSYISIGETSELIWGSGQVLTVVDEFQLWPRLKRMVKEVDGEIITINEFSTDSDGNPLVPDDLYMDWDVIYVDYNEIPAPVVIMGSHIIGWIPSVGGAINVTIDASDSYDPNQAAALTYAWQAEGHIANTSATANFITLTYDTPGEYRITCTVTNVTTGRQASGHRYIFIYDNDNLPTKDFTLDECDGSWDEGGWSFKVTMHDEATLTEIRDRTLIVLFSRDYYGASEQYVGPLDGYEKNLVVGWVDGESIVWNPLKGTVEFEVKGANWWLKQITNWPTWAQDSDINLATEDEIPIVPFAWNNFDDMTVDKVLLQFLRWRCTANAIMDIFLTEDDRQIPHVNIGENNLWDHIDQIAEDTILAKPCVDRLGRLYVEINTNAVLVSMGRNFPVVMDITQEDWRSRVEFGRRSVDPVGKLDLSGVSYVDGLVIPQCTEGGGTAWGHYGTRQRFDKLLLWTDTALGVELSATVLAWLNNDFPFISIPLSANNKAIDICPRQYVTLSVAVGDTERGIVWSAKKVIPRSVSYTHTRGRLLTNITGETDIGESIENDLVFAQSIPCLTTPDNDPTQPEKDEQIPVVPEWPQEPCCGGGSDSELSLTRNSFMNLGFEGVDNPDVGKSIAKSLWIVSPFVKVLNDGNDIDDNVVSSNKYIYWHSNNIVYRKVFKYTDLGLRDKNISFGGDGTTHVGGIALLTGDIVCMGSRDGSSNLFIKTIDFSDLSQTSEDWTTIISIPFRDGDNNQYRYDNDHLFVVLGEDENLYVVVTINFFDIILGQYTHVYYYIYDWTNSIGYDPVIVSTDDPKPDKGSGIWLESPPVIFGSEIVFGYQLDLTGAGNPDSALTIHNVNVETRSANSVFLTSNDTRINLSPWQLSPDRTNRVVYFWINSDSVVDTINNPIMKYDLAANTISKESDNLGTDFPGAEPNFPQLAYDKEYAYKIPEIITTLGVDGFRLVDVVNYSLPSQGSGDSSSFEYFGKYAVDDADRIMYVLSAGVLYGVLDGGWGVVRSLDLSGDIDMSILSATQIVIQGNLLLVVQRTPAPDRFNIYYAVYENPILG